MIPRQYELVANSLTGPQTNLSSRKILQSSPVLSDIIPRQCSGAPLESTVQNDYAARGTERKELKLALFHHPLYLLTTRYMWLLHDHSNGNNEG